MIRLADYVMRSLADWGVRHIFLVTGGGAMHLNDAIGREGRIRYICHHHEQAAAMAAEGYSRVTGKPGVVSVTRARRDQCPEWRFRRLDRFRPDAGDLGTGQAGDLHGPLQDYGLRQLGDQEVDIVRDGPGNHEICRAGQRSATIRYHLERAFHLAATGRPGPCWLDMPIDVQSATIDEECCKAV